MVRQWILCATCSRPGLLMLKSGRLSTCSGTKAHPQIGKSCQWWSTLRAMHSSLSVCTHWLFNISFLIDYFILYVIQIFMDLLVSKQIKRLIFIWIAFLWNGCLFGTFSSLLNNREKTKIIQHLKIKHFLQ